MRRVVRIVSLGALSALFAVAITGCVGPSSIRVTGRHKDKEYVSLVRAVKPDAKWKNDKEIVRSGHKICAALDQGESVDDVFDSMYLKRDPIVIGALLAFAPGTYCPRWSKDVQRWIDSE